MNKPKLNLKQWMSFRKKGKVFEPLEVFRPEPHIVVGVYQGSLSKFDILIKYRQIKKDGKWSRIRTPKHIHWAVDLLIKMHADRKKIQEFLDFLIDIWNKTSSFQSEEERKKFLNIRNLLDVHKDKIRKYQKISNFGEYRVEFLILLAKLLMAQEKTNMPDAYMFRKLLEALKKGEDIFSIVSIATHRGR
ncbi:hypothetical protein ES703_109505 [subsurface metagenome]